MTTRHIHNNYVAASLLFTAALIAGVLALYVPDTPVFGSPTGFATTASQVGNLSVNIATSVACTWSNAALNVDFGTSLDPGTNDYNATGNYNQSGGDGGTDSSQNHTMYNVTVSTLTNVNVDVVMSGLDLYSGANYMVIGNVTWASNTTIQNGSNFHSEDSIKMNSTLDGNNNVSSDEAAGSAVWYRFWLDIPSAQVAGSYTGNYTQQCQES